VETPVNLLRSWKVEKDTPQEKMKRAKQINRMSITIGREEQNSHANLS